MSSAAEWCGSKKTASEKQMARQSVCRMLKVRCRFALTGILSCLLLVLQVQSGNPLQIFHKSFLLLLPLFFVGSSQNRGRTKGGHHVRSQGRFDKFAAMPGHTKGLPKERLRGGGPETNQHRRVDDRHFFVQPGTACGDLLCVWFFVDAPFPAGFPLKMLHGIGYVYFFPVDAGFVQQPIEKPSSGPDEGFSLQVFLMAGLLADHHDFCARTTRSKNGLRAGSPQVAVFAMFGFLRERSKRFRGFRERQPFLRFCGFHAPLLPVKNRLIAITRMAMATYGFAGIRSAGTCARLTMPRPKGYKASRRIKSEYYPFPSPRLPERPCVRPPLPYVFTSSPRLPHASLPLFACARPYPPLWCPRESPHSMNLWAGCLAAA